MIRVRGGLMLKVMSQIRDPRAWCAALQAKLMAALDAAWALIEDSTDPAVIALARVKARACGQMAADVRKIAGMVPLAPPAKTRREPVSADGVLERLEAMTPEMEDADDKPPAAQAVAIRAALRKLGRRSR